MEIKKSIMNVDDLYKELELTRKRGYGIDNREVENHMLCFAAQVFNYNGECVVAISISDMYSKDDSYEYLGNRIKEVGYLISEKLGYRKNN